MRVFTPVEVAKQAGNKYVGVLVAAKFARFVNDFPKDRSFQYEKKLTTTSLEHLSGGTRAASLLKRLRRAGEELAQAREYDYVVVNADRTEALAEVSAILDAESRRPCRNPELEGNLTDLSRELAGIADRLEQTGEI